MVSEWEHPLGVSFNIVASPLKLSATPVRQDLPPPLLGQHTAQVLQEVLGMNAADIQRLRDQQVI
jgi:crotonobetainyl-CoA:carnitine CoA-transferase CaiB-like acyl-CoA transferase